MRLSVKYNRIFWEAAVECLHFGSRGVRNPYAESRGKRGVLFGLAQAHAACIQGDPSAVESIDQCLTALRALAPEVRALAPEVLQSAEALQLTNRLAKVAVLLRQKQAHATDIESSAEVRRKAQEEVDKLLVERTNLSTAIDEFNA